jgi:hypothetical protein
MASYTSSMPQNIRTYFLGLARTVFTRPIDRIFESSLQKIPYIHRIYIWFWQTLLITDLITSGLELQTWDVYSNKGAGAPHIYTFMIPLPFHYSSASAVKPGCTYSNPNKCIRNRRTQLLRTCSCGARMRVTARVL